MINRIYDPNCASACFFRSSVKPPKMKIMLQITERCNLKCAHCFAESRDMGDEIDLESVQRIIIPQFIKNQVVKVTLTGGEPLVHQQFTEIATSLLEKGIGVSICTNGTLIDPAWVKWISPRYNNLHFNVSLDGLTMQSHGKFRGIISESTLATIIHNICLLGKLKLLNGILATPNKYATIDEYVELCKFAKKAGANYVLMNPLSPFGRGTKTQLLAYSNEEMISLQKATSFLISKSFEMVYIRFPNSEHKPIGKCPLGSIPYIFCNGDIAICPYMVFASNGNNNYRANDFIVGNIFGGADIANSINEYILGKTFNFTQKDKACIACSRGCYAIKISNNQSLSDCDLNICPINGE